MSQYSTKHLKNYIAPEYYISSTHLHFDIYENYTTVKAQYDVYRNQSSSTDKFIFLDGDNLELKSIHLDGSLLGEDKYKCSDSGLVIHEVPEKFILDIETKIIPAENKALAGLYKSQSILVTQCEPHGFRRITYSLDRPDVSSIYTTSITADISSYPILLSNGDKAFELNIDDNRKLVVWHDPHPKPSYLFALVAGDLSRVSNSYTTRSNRNINLELYVTPGSEDQCEFALEAVKKAMHWDEQKYSREYDLDTFMIVATEDFNNGAMENKGLNIFNISCINTHKNLSTDSEFLRVASVVGHEYFHNWSGNRVTCRDWFQLSLKEGLTVYRESQFMEDTFPLSLNRLESINKLIAYQFTEDASPLAHPVQPDSYIEVNNFYTSTIYEKGAEVIRMIQTIIGDQNYFKGISDYFAKFDGGCATIDDFVSCLEQASGYELSQFKNWYKQQGTPTIKINTSYSNNNSSFSINITQQIPHNDQNAELYPLVIPVEVAFFSKTGNKLEVSFSEQKSFKHLLILKDISKEYHFTHVDNEPTVSFLRGLSAPVKLKYDYSIDDLHTLIINEEDEYNRWDAVNRLHKLELVNVLDSINRGDKPTVSERYLNIFEELLSKVNDQNQYSITGYLLQLPKVKVFLQDFTEINISNILNSYEIIKQTVYHTHKEGVDNLFAKLQSINLDEDTLKAKRILQNSLLDYITSDRTEKEAQFLVDILKSTKNITEQLSALFCLNKISSEQTESQLNYFYDKWKGQPLTYEKWLRLVSGSCSSQIYNKIMKIKQEDPKFSYTNPNHVRALFGFFSMENLLYFHSPDGQGYKLLLSEILEIDKFNPHLSSRLITVFANWRKFVDSNKNMMHQGLQDIMSAEKISKNLFEMTEKILS